MTLIKCNLPSCNNEFEQRKGKQYCSGTCRSKASIIKSAGLGGFTTPPAPKPDKEDEPVRKPITVADGSMLTQLPIHAQFIIKQLEKETARWEAEYKEERQARKKLKDENKDLRNQLAEIKTEQKINGIEAEYKKPTGLDGFAESQLGQQLLPHIGPALGKLADRFVESIPMEMAAGGALPQVAGISGAINEQLTQISNWFATQGPDVQEVFYALVNEMAGLKPDEAKIKMKYIKNLLRYGTTATGTNG